MSDLSGNSLSVSKRRAKPIQLAPWASAIAGSIDWTSLGDDPMGDIQIFAGATSQEALRQRLRGEVEAEVAAMLDAIKEFDAFDVIELIRLREIPVVPVAALVDDHDGSAAAIDLVSLEVNRRITSTAPPFCAARDPSAPWPPETPAPTFNPGHAWGCTSNFAGSRRSSSGRCMSENSV
jgi:hypothetical protein